MRRPSERSPPAVSTSGCWNVDRADKGQGYDRTHARDSHQPLTDFIVAREQENLAMQLGKLFTQDPARGE
jgi:hypothetical protein